jgi:cytidine deaminase
MAVTDQDWSQLLAAAREAAGRAYCPYSRFPVGAAILLAGGEIVAGCNVENASYGLTICAERNAIFRAVARASNPLIVRAVLVYTPTPAPTAPCGACRQVINEFGPDAAIRCVCDGPQIIETSLADLLPSAFGPRNLHQ